MDVMPTPSSKGVYNLPSIPLNTRWKQNGITIAGGHKHGKALNQLLYPYGLYVDDDQTAFITDLGNHCIVKWMCGATRGQVVAGGNEAGNRIDQLKEPSDVIVDKETDSFIICDFGNRRMMRWCEKWTQGDVIIGVNDPGAQANQLNSPVGFSFDCYGNFYVVDFENDRVQRFSIEVSS